LVGVLKNRSYFLRFKKVGWLRRTQKWFTQKTFRGGIN